MTEAELYQALHLSLNATNSLMFGYMSLLSGFLLLSYLAADKLTPFLASIVVTLFSIAACLLIFRMYINRSEATEIGNYIRVQQRAGNLDMDWFGTVPNWAPVTSGFLEVALALGGLIGGIVFFVYQRKTQREAK